MVKSEKFSAFLRRFQGDALYRDFDIANVPIDTQGFQSPDNAAFFIDIFHTFQPRCLLELGSWKGTSAIMFAKHMQVYCDPVIACVDTWLGSLEHWNNPEWREQLGLRNGFPTLYERFLANVVRADVAPFITPLPMTTKTAIALAKMSGVKVDAIYVDASHEYLEVLDDLNGVWSLIEVDGIIVVDDYKAPDVHRAVNEFCEQPGIFGLCNTDSPWPEALIVQSADMRKQAIQGHSDLVDVHSI